MNGTAFAAVRACDSYDLQEVESVVERLFRDAPPPDLEGKTVLVKPNIVMPKKPESAAVTHPAVVYAIIKAVTRRGAKKTLCGDSPGGVISGEAAAKTAGIYEAAINAGAEWAPFNRAVQVAIPEGRLLKTAEVAAEFAEADVVISAAKLKTHRLMGYTGVLKNLFGAVRGLQKARCHYRFQDKESFSVFLNDLVYAAKQYYGVMDAVIAMDGPDGPGNGDPCRVGALCASSDLLALDWLCAELVGYNPEEIGNLKDALSRGRWITDPSQITVLGDSLDELRPANFRIVKNPRGTELLKSSPRWVQKAARFIFSKYPRFRSARCIRCGKCCEVCPAKALTLVKAPAKNGAGGKGRIVLNRKKCLQCYCCHELCPVNAVRLSRF